MLEFWLTDPDTLLDYIAAAKLFDYEFAVERPPGSKSYHLTVYTDKFRAAAAKAAGLE